MAIEGTPVTDRRIKERRQTDITLSSLNDAFLQHISHEERFEKLQSEMQKSLECIRSTVDSLKMQMPQIHSVITSWTQTKGIFWITSLAVLTTIGAVRSADWLLEQAARLF